MSAADNRPEEALGRLASTWDTSRTSWKALVAERLVELAGLRPGMAVLDVGCGVGAATFAAARVVGNAGMVVGVDSAAVMVMRARHEATRLGIKNVLFACEDAAPLPYAPYSFHALIASMTLSYLPFPAKTVHGWAQLLSGGGTLVYSWVIRDDPAWLPVLKAVDAFLPPEHSGWANRKQWTVREAEDLLPPNFNVNTVTELLTTRYDNADHFWAAVWTEAPAIVGSWIPESQRDNARTAAFAELADLQARDGSLERTRTVCYTVARLVPSAFVPAPTMGD